MMTVYGVYDCGDMIACYVDESVANEERDIRKQELRDEFPNMGFELMVQVCPILVNTRLR